jgi:hypothetical protein
LRKQKENATNQHLQPKNEGCVVQIPHNPPERTSAKENKGELCAHKCAHTVKEPERVISIQEETEKQRKQKQSENAVNRFTKDENVACGHKCPEATKEPERVIVIQEEIENQHRLRQSENAINQYTQKEGSGYKYPLPTKEANKAR